MGPVISIIGSAIAFSGTNYAFSKLSDHGEESGGDIIEQ